MPETTALKDDPNRLAADYLRAYRDHRFDQMAMVSAGHEVALLSGLLGCADAVAPVFGEVLDDMRRDAGMSPGGLLEHLDEWVQGAAVSDPVILAVAVSMVADRAGLSVGNRWVRREAVVLTHDVISNVCFHLAALLLAQIEGTAVLTDRGHDGTFNHFVGLLEA